MKIRLRKNWLSILAEREVPQSRNCLWWDEFMINYDGYGLCCVWRGLWNQECMDEWACITCCNQARRLGLQGIPLWFWPFFFFFLLVRSAQSRTVMRIIPLPHYGNNFATTNFGRKMCRSPPPPPPAVVRAGAILSETFCHDFGSVVSITYLHGVMWYGNGSGVAGCSWWRDSTCCGIGWGWM